MISTVALNFHDVKLKTRFEPKAFLTLHKNLIMEFC